MKVFNWLNTRLSEPSFRSGSGGSRIGQDLPSSYYARFECLYLFFSFKLKTKFVSSHSVSNDKICFYNSPQRFCVHITVSRITLIPKRRFLLHTHTHTHTHTPVFVLGRWSFVVRRISPSDSLLGSSNIRAVYREFFSPYASRHKLNASVAVFFSFTAHLMFIRSVFIKCERWKSKAS